MAQHIEREAAYKFMFDIPNPNGAGEIEVVSVDDLESIPAADVVSVVRCGECVHSALDYIGERYCKGVAHTSCCHVPDDWFCADGKRKDGDENV